MRLDVYFRDNLHGFKPPQRVADDPRDPWLIWSGQQIVEADAVLMFCTPQYVDTDPDHGAKPGGWWNWCQMREADRIATQVPALWWDWLAIARECTDRPQKFIPIGIGPYHGDQIPAFVRGASYLNLSDEGAFDALLRRIRQVWRERVPRRGVFISYAHKDDQAWLDNLLSHLSWLKRQHGVEFWTDREIEPGDKCHETIQAALDRAKVAVLLVSPDFLASPYITSDELPAMLEAAETEGMKIFWIPVRPSAYKHSPIAKFQAAQTPDKPRPSRPRRRAIEKPDHRHRRLLRAGRERPRGHRAAEKRDELASSNVTCHAPLRRTHAQSNNITSLFGRARSLATARSSWRAKLELRSAINVDRIAGDPTCVA